MVIPAREAVDHHLRRLNTASCRDLVADLWTARGFETSVEGNVVVATRGGTRQVIYPVGRRRFGSPPAPDRPVDAVVAVADGEDAIAAVGKGAQPFDATDLRKMLFYAIDRETTARLCERHLGARPEQLRPPLRTRMRRRASEPVTRTRVAAAVALAAVALVVLGVGVVALTDASGAGADPGTEASVPSLDRVVAVAGPDNRSAITGSASLPDEATASDIDASRLPPGVSATGITNLSALADAHARAVGNQSYTLWLDLYQTRGREPGGERLQRDMDVAVAGERHLLRTETENESGGRRPVQTVYHDGTSWYVADHDNGTVSYRRASSKPPLVAPEPSRLEDSLVLDYLSARETTVTRVEGGGEVRYQIVGEGQSAARRSRTVGNYTVTATVTPEGLVRDLAVTADIRTRTGSHDVRFEVTYGRFSETTVEQPEWVSREFGDDATTGTRSTDK